jgi:signal transduction histidine kinase
LPTPADIFIFIVVVIVVVVVVVIVGSVVQLAKVGRRLDVTALRSLFGHVSVLDV